MYLLKWVFTRLSGLIRKKFCHRGTEANAYFVVLICTTVNVGAASAANNPSDRDEFAAEAAPAKLKTSVFSVTSVANI